MKNNMSKNQLFNILCVVLMIALVVCHFLPFWSFAEETLSVWEYVGFPLDHKPVTKEIKATFDNFDLNDVALMPSFAIFLGVLALIFVFKSSEDLWFSFFPVVVGALGIHAYLFVPLYQMGSMWFLPLIISVLMFGCAIAAILFWVKENKKS